MSSDAEKGLAQVGCAGQWFGLLALIIAIGVGLFFVCTIIWPNKDSKCWDASWEAQFGETVEEMREGARYFSENCTWNEDGVPAAK